MAFLFASSASLIVLVLVVVLVLGLWYRSCDRKSRGLWRDP